MAYLKVSGIYEIDCVPSGKLYVGSAVSIYGRLASHRSELRRGVHANRHLQNAWNKHGEAAFVFRVIERCPVECLIEREQHWIDTKQVADPKFGMNNSPTASTTIGFRHSEETKRLLSEKAAERDHSHLLRHAESCRGKPAPNRGKPGKKWSEEQRVQASLQRKGRKAWNAGVPMLEEVKEKISAHWKAAAANDPLRQKACELRATGMFYADIAKLIGVSLAQAHRYSNHIPVGPRRGLKRTDNVKGAAK